MKTHCHFENCKNELTNVTSIIGKCNYCFYIYCNVHRFVDNHKCLHLQEYLNNQRNSLEKSLVKTINSKIN
jgi:predicted nucleic acid binding AN1-type Zn finger protein